LVKIKRITYIGKDDVYNMEVKDHHNYAVNGGLIISNCESIRYGCMSRPGKTEIYSSPDLSKLPVDCLEDWDRTRSSEDRIKLLERWGRNK
jgi:hypothetical protein